MFFNDARHFYLYCYEPPLSLEDAWQPVDELAGTSIDTLIFGVESGGLFNKTKVGLRWGADQRPFTGCSQWRAWYNMQSLMDRGLDPLQVLIDRAHNRGMDFFISMRIGTTPREQRYKIGVAGASGGGAGSRDQVADFAHEEIRRERFTWLEELAGYGVEGIELDFAFTPFYFKPDKIRAGTALMTEYVRSISQMIRSKGKNRLIGARVFPTEQMNLGVGLDVRAWLVEKLIDYVAPMYYPDFTLDPNLPFDWMVKLAHDSGASVYPILQPNYLCGEQSTNYLTGQDSATPAMMRAAAANYWSRGADGLITWFLHWPFRDAERSILTELGDPELVREKDKHYVLPQRVEAAAVLGFDRSLPLKLAKTSPGPRGEIPFYVADDLRSNRVARVRLLLKVDNLVTADRLKVELNDADLSGEELHRTRHTFDQWLEYTLVSVRPAKGQNVLALTLESRPDGLEGLISVEVIELIVEYDQPRATDRRPEAV